LPDNNSSLSLTAQLGQRLKLARQRRDMSIEELCRLTRLDEVMVRRIEDGLTRPTAADLVTLATALDIRLSALFR
jgi:transcriptional regulator with XRE-family HTH domain